MALRRGKELLEVAKQQMARGEHVLSVATFQEATRLFQQVSAEAAETVAATPVELSTTVAPFSSIDAFFTTSSKDMNDATNKLRETYLATLLDKEPEEGEDPRIATLRVAWRTALTGLCPTAFTDLSVEQKGGRSANYDFLVSYKQEDGEVVHRQPVEFKYGGTSVGSHPQFLSLAEKAMPFPISYAEYFYTRYLPDYCATDEELADVAVPDKETYLATVYSAAYDRHPFYAKAYGRSEQNKAAKKAVVDASIAAFLEEYGPGCALGHLTELFKAKELGKAFLLWDRDAGVFHVDRFTEEDLTVVTFVGIRNQNTLVVRSATREFRLLLRWKNHAGVLYPAWQIGLARAC